MDLDTTVFACSDPDVVAGYLAHVQLEQDLLNLAVEEGKERWRRLPMVTRGEVVTAVIGLALREHDWTYEASYARHKAQREADGEAFWGFNPDRFEPVVIPDGWRKRAKDTHLSPPLKGSSDAIKAAQDYCRRWRMESVRGYLQRVHGAPAHHFAGLRLITIGADVKEDRLWIISGKGYAVGDERFQPVPLSEYVAMRERNPAVQSDEDAA